MTLKHIVPCQECHYCNAKKNNNKNNVCIVFDFIIIMLFMLKKETSAMPILVISICHWFRGERCPGHVSTRFTSTWLKWPIDANREILPVRQTVGTKDRMKTVSNRQKLEDMKWSLNTANKTLYAFIHFFQTTYGFKKEIELITWNTSSQIHNSSSHYNTSYIADIYKCVEARTLGWL